MKNVYLDIIGKRHSLYNELVNHPPEGYNFMVDENPWDKTTQTIANNETIYWFQRNILSKVVPVNLAKSYVERLKRIPSNVDLTYSSGHIIFRDEPWIADCEYITHFAGYNYTHYSRYRRVIEKRLADANCKKIIPWTDEGAKTVCLTVKDKRIIEKVETVNLAVRPKIFTKQFNKNNVKLLFVGSANIPKDFDIKGGKEVVEAFIRLTKKYDNLELVIRSYVPEHVKQRCKKIENIRIIDSVIPWNVLEEEFKISDIFLFPSYNTPGLAILDAMSYELPVITTNVWANKEMVQDGKSGYLIDCSTEVQYYTNEGVPNWSSPDNLKRIINYTDERIVDQLVVAISNLIENESERRQMGVRGRELIKTGKFSIAKRNQKLKQIFEESIPR